MKTAGAARSGSLPTAADSRQGRTNNLDSPVSSRADLVRSAKNSRETNPVRAAFSLSWRTRIALIVAAVLVALAALVDVSFVLPRVSIRWTDAVRDDQRAALEQRYDLRRGELDSGTTWRYDLGTRSRDNIEALIQDPAVADTGYIDRDAMTVPRPDVRVSWRSFPYPFSDRFDHPSQLLQLHQSVWLLLAGAVLLWAARAASGRRRRHVAVAV